MTPPAPRTTLTKDDALLWRGVVLACVGGFFFSLLFLVGAFNTWRAGAEAVAVASQALTGVAVLAASGYGLLAATRRLRGPAA